MRRACQRTAGPAGLRGIWTINSTACAHVVLLPCLVKLSKPPGTKLVPAGAGGRELGARFDSCSHVAHGSGYPCTAPAPVLLPSRLSSLWAMHAVVHASEQPQSHVLGRFVCDFSACTLSSGLHMISEPSTRCSRMYGGNRATI